MSHPSQNQKQSQLGHAGAPQSGGQPEDLGHLFQHEEHTEDGTQSGWGRIGMNTLSVTPLRPGGTC